MLIYHNFSVESPLKKILKKVQLKAKKQGEDSKERIEDETMELYPIDETMEEAQEEVLVKSVKLFKLGNFKNRKL